MQSDEDGTERNGGWFLPGDKSQNRRVKGPRKVKIVASLSLQHQTRKTVKEVIHLLDNVETAFNFMDEMFGKKHFQHTLDYNLTRHH